MRNLAQAVRSTIRQHEASSFRSSMNVIALTILVSSCLAGIFVACFILELRRSKHASPEHDSLLPLDDPSTDPKP